MKILKTANYNKIANDYLNKVDQYPPNYKALLEKARQKIISTLQDHNLEKVVFNDVGASGIQIQGVHKSVPRYYFITVNVQYDLTDLNKATQEFISRWLTNENDTNWFKNFTNEMSRHGAD